ncbi:MAG TPA: radical SAM protein [Desulfobacteraceae bacterium]|nr:radical SAM protein [Desulfobacteraceae bacterium]
MPLIIPVFIPHQGCPHTCIFCNQHRISGRAAGAAVTAADVQDTITAWLDRSPGRNGDDVQVAFYGGSFTGLPGSRQQELLQAVEPFLGDDRVGSIRLSTRPDYIDGAAVAFLRNHGVATVEIGVQSLDDRVLEASCRGHKAAHTFKAVEHLRHGGMETGLQLMLGLPEQSFYSLRQTVKQAAALQPDFVRIYPVLVLRDSGLSSLHGKGMFQPLSLGKAVAQAAWMKKYFAAHGVRVVRTGLQPGRELEDSLVAGPYHPAFGELVSSRIMLQQTRKALQCSGNSDRQVLAISTSDVSIFRGVKSSNIRRLKELGLDGRYVLITDREQPRFTLRKLSTVPMKN